MTRLYKYQRNSVRQILGFNGRALLALEMGLGKTLVSLTYLQTRRIPTLVVCPASAKWVWAHEIRKHTCFSGRILSGKQPQTYLTNKAITIINYDIVPSWVDYLLRMKFQLLILDECQYIKNWKAKRTRAVLRLGKRIPRILALSGTPLTNRPKELYNTLHLIDPQTFPSFVPYAFRYCQRRMTPWGWDDTGASHLDELHQKLVDSCMIRYTKKQVLHELPPKQRIVVPLPTERSQEYEQAENDFVGWLSKKILAELPDEEFAKKVVQPRLTGRPKSTNSGWWELPKLEKTLKAESLTKLGYLKQLAAEIKMKYVIEWIENFLEETDEKLVVFAYHKKIIDKLTKTFPCAVSLDGRTSPKNRRRNVNRFQRDHSTRVFVGQMTAAGTAISLTAASTCVFAELDWVPGNHIQAEDRLHRIGQENHVQIYYLVAKGTLEEKLCNIIQKKAKIIAAILDGHNVHDEMDVFDQLLQRLMSYRRRSC